MLNIPDFAFPIKIVFFPNFAYLRNCRLHRILLVMTQQFVPQSSNFLFSASLSKSQDHWLRDLSFHHNYLHLPLVWVISNL